MGSCQSDLQPIKSEASCKKIKTINRANFEHPKQIQESVSSVDSFSQQQNSSPSESPFQTAGQINTQDWNESKVNIQMNTSKRLHTSLNFNSLSPLRKLSNGNLSDYSVELVEAVQLHIPNQVRKSRRRVTTKIDLLNKVKQMKYSEKLKRKRT